MELIWRYGEIEMELNHLVLGLHAARVREEEVRCDSGVMSI